MLKMFLPEGITSLWQMSPTWHYLKGLLKAMQLITRVVIAALLLRYLKWFIIDSLILESAEHLHFYPWTPKEMRAGAEAPQMLDTLRSALAALCASTAGRPDPAAGTGLPMVLRVLSPVCFSDLRTLY